VLFFSCRECALMSACSSLLLEQLPIKAHNRLRTTLDQIAHCALKACQR
jgi:hypothetical protein